MRDVLCFLCVVLSSVLRASVCMPESRLMSDDEHEEECVLQLFVSPLSDDDNMRKNACYSCWSVRCPMTITRGRMRVTVVGQSVVQW